MRRKGREERSRRIIGLPAAPMLFRPITGGNLDLVDRLTEAPASDDRDGQPGRPLRRLDAVAITPAVLGELRIIIDDERVHHVDDVEIAFPGNVVRLDDGDLLRSARARFDRHARPAFASWPDAV